MVQYGEIIQVDVFGPKTKTPPYNLSNLVNHYGLSEWGNKQATHDNDSLGNTMWSYPMEEDTLEIVFDFKKVYPLKEMLFYNFNQPKYTNIGLRMVSIMSSIDDINYTLYANKEYVELKKADGSEDLKPTNLVNDEIVDFQGQSIRYVKIVVRRDKDFNWSLSQSNRIGLSKVCFFVGEGYMVYENKTWTELFKRSKGWTGSDGVFSIPMTGNESSKVKQDTVITFGDTLIDWVDEKTKRRSDQMVMINNSYCKIEGSIPDNKHIEFFYTVEDDVVKSVLIPSKEISDVKKQLYFWPQDSVLVKDKVYTYPYLVYEYPEGPEGFQFKIDGVAMLESDVHENSISFEKCKQKRTNLYYEDEKLSISFGGCVYNNTSQVQAPNSEGYIYIYGVKQQVFEKGLVVARVSQEEISKGDRWQFYNGKDWTDNIVDCHVLATMVSNEMSVSYIKGKLHHGKYILVFQESGNLPYIAYRIGDSLVGPFGEMHKVYFTPEVLEGKGIYTYNAKAHPHLAEDGEFLISYNVNTISWEMHMRDGTICRPRFITMKEIVKND